MVNVTDKDFERTNAQLTHPYLDLDLNEHDLFKDMKDGQLVDEEDKSEQETIFPREDNFLPHRLISL